MLTDHLSTEQLATVKQQHPQIFLQQKRYIKWVMIIAVGIFLYYLFSSNPLVFPGRHLLMVASK